MNDLSTLTLKTCYMDLDQVHKLTILFDDDFDPLGLV